MDVAAWLQGLGLARYVPAFRDNEIDWETLPKLTAEDLKDLGVVLGSHRRKLLDAIAALDAEAPATETAASRDAAAPAGAERRQLTVMFCDLVGSTALASRLDPEDLREVIAAYHRCVTDLVRSFDGFVAKYMGDGVLVYFGYPRAHEDDAERAIRSGLGVIDSVRRLDVRAAKLQARIGISTGLVVVGDLIGEGSAQEQAVVGETPNLAARLQALAEPDTVVIAASTRRLVGDLFECRDLGAIEVKGIAEPVPAWQVLRSNVVASRFEALRLRATLLVGREEDIELLRRRWRQAEGGEGQVVLVAGEAGIGKSRLTAALLEELASAPQTHLRYFCSPHHTDSALYPIIGQLEHAAGFAPDASRSAKLDKLDILLSQVATPAEDCSLIAELLLLGGTDQRYPTLDLTPQIRRERTLAALMRQLEALAQRQPVLMVFEDVHWIDPTSLELLDRTVERVRTLPALLLVTFRPEFAAPWIGQPYVTTLTLRRLGVRDSAALAGHVSGNHALSAELLNEIVRRADGVPLFLEELTKAVVEARPGEDEDVIAAVPSASAAIPATLQASLAARLDRLGPAKEIAQIGAVIGREFSYELLRMLTALTGTRLAAALDQLVASELVSRRGVPPMASYVFKHALVQETAHETLLRTERRRLHTRIADLLEERAETAERQPELLAQHYAEAGLNDKAVDYWTRAGKRSVSRLAMTEAEAQFEKALVQLALLPDTCERAWKELELQSSLGSVRLSVRGFAAPQTGESYARAYELWEELGYPAPFLRVPWGQFVYTSNRGDLELARHFVDNLLRLSEERGDAIWRILGHLGLGVIFMILGEFTSSRMHLEAVVNFYAQDQKQIFIDQAGFDAHVMALEFLGLVLSCLGYPDQGMARGAKAVEEARATRHLPSLATALAVKTRVLAILGGIHHLGECAETLFTLGDEQGYPFWREQGRIYRSLAQVRHGEIEEGLASLRIGISGYRATGAEVWMSLLYAFESEAEVLRGNTEAAFGILDHALQISRARDENWFEAELVRRRGELFRKRDSSNAEALFREALEIAQHQQAKLWELRAPASLALVGRGGPQGRGSRSARVSL